MRFDKTNTVLFLILILIWSCQGTKKLTEVDITDESEVLEKAEREVSSKADLIQTLEFQLSEYRASRTRHFDLLHTALDLSFDYENQWVLGEAVLTLKPYFYPQKEIVYWMPRILISMVLLCLGQERLRN
jgi:aminopeptidase N